MRKLFITFMVLCCGSSLAQIQVTDFNLDTSGSSQSHFLDFNNEVFFLFAHSEYGREIWKTDGTIEGTQLLKDINLGSGSFRFDNFLVHKDKLYFIADDNIHGDQLWVSDGTSEGTERVTNSINYPVTEIISDGEFIYFLKGDVGGVTLWRSDGTQEGTTLVKGPIPAASPARNLTSALGMLFFSVQDAGTQSSRVWRTDGTEQGTFAITDAIQGNGAVSEPSHHSQVSEPAHPSQFIEYKGALYFVVKSAFDNTKEVGIVRTDGTIEGTVNLTGLYTDEPVDFGDVTVYEDKLYFSFFQRENHRFFIWESQGMAENTREVYDFTSNGIFSPSNLVGLDGRLFFTSGNDAAGTSLFSLDPLAPAFEEVIELTGPREDTPVEPLEDINQIVLSQSGELFVKSIVRSYTAAELWITDGTSAGSSKLNGMAPLSNLILADGGLVYSGGTDRKFNPWYADGKETRIISDIGSYTNGGNFALDFYEINNHMVFIADHPDAGYEPWFTDGTVAGTSVLDLFPGEQRSYLYNFFSRSGYLFFVGRIAEVSWHIFVSDGTASGTKSLTELPAKDWATPQIIPGWDEHIFTFSRKADNTTSLFAVDIGDGALTEIRNFASIGLRSYGIINETLYFEAGDGLWKSDGTTAGTEKVMELNLPGPLVQAGDFIYYVDALSPGTSEKRLYRTDGTVSGTSSLTDDSGVPIGSANSLLPFDSNLIFTHGNNIWLADGTDSKATRLTNFSGGNGVVSTFTTLGNSFFFVARESQFGDELWKSDGTPTGTVMVKDIFPGPEGSRPSELVSTGERLYFSAYTPESGFEVWTSNGTDEGTTLLVDVNPGPAYSHPRAFVKTGDQLLFIAKTAAAGRQLWSYEHIVTSVPEVVRPRVSAYPNQFTNIVNIEAGAMAGARLTMFNAYGQCVLADVHLNEVSSLDLGGFPSGLYLMTLAKGDGMGMVTLKVVKK